MPRIVLIVAVLAVLALCGWFFYFGKNIPTNPSSYMTKTVSIGGNNIVVQVADTAPKRELGLSGRASLPSGEGMLFIFDTPGRYGFWMKDMNFSIDILFADAHGTVVSIYKSVSPASYTQKPPQVFYPAAPVLYVLEVPAGYADAHGISQGSTIVIQ